jgi:hypothetical protein
MRMAGTALAALALMGVGPQPDPALGSFAGTGRACAGTLSITPSRIAWNTPFSRCASTGYSVISREDGQLGLRAVYRLSGGGAQCRYHVLVLTHAAGAEPGIGWNVVGYPTMEAAAANRAEDSLSCYLVR